MEVRRKVANLLNVTKSNVTKSRFSENHQACLNGRA